MSDPVIRVLVVDDSAYVRKVMRHMLTEAGSIEVVGTARDGEEALELVEQLQPDVVTLDLIMPQLDGLGFLRAQQKRRPVPVLVVSLTGEGGEMALAALDAGAFDFIQKPTALATEKIYEMRADLLAKVRAAAGQRPDQRPAAAVSGPPVVQPRPPKGTVDVVVIGISTGGPQALRQLIPQLPADFAVPVVVVMHMPPGYTEMYAHRLNEIAPLHVTEAAEGDELRPGRVLIAPAGQHLTFAPRAGSPAVVHLDMRPADTPHRPSVDVLFQSAATVFQQRVLGVVMTGMGNDGQQGAAWIKAEGGQVFTETEASCVVYGMPRAVVEAGCSDRQIALDGLAQALVESI
jgi:two-component system chemotaxis response regulator CheB